MGLFRRRKTAEGRASSPSPMPPGPSPLGGRPGRIPASGAVDLTDPIVAAFDGNRILVGIASDTNIDAQGLSREWDLFYDLPGRASQVNARIEPCEGTGDDAQLCLYLRETPFLRPHRDEAAARKVAQELGLSWEQFEARRAELAMADRKPALPMPFRDSPVAVASLAEVGIDFVSGPTDIALSTKRKEDGSVVWEVQAGGMQAETAFTDSPADGT